MPNLTNYLPAWEIGFRWAGRPAPKQAIRVPLEAQDHFRNLMDAILKGELFCATISLEKENTPRGPSKFSVYRYLNDIEACIAGKKFDRKLLKWALIERGDFKLWCERRNIPLPEFWFPPGWSLAYDRRDDDLLPGHEYIRQRWSPAEWAAWRDERQALKTKDAITPCHEEEVASNLRPNQKARIACQQIAQAIWQKDPNRTITSVSTDVFLKEYGGGKPFTQDTLRAWVKAVAPPNVSARRGRPPKNGGGEK